MDREAHRKHETECLGPKIGTETKTAYRHRQKDYLYMMAGGCPMPFSPQSCTSVCHCRAECNLGHSRT